MDTQVQIENLIQRYLAGETSEQEAQEMQFWLQASEENRQLFAHHKKMWMGSSILAGYGTDKIKQDKRKVNLKIRNSELQRNLDNANRRIRVLAYAASVIFLLGITSVFYMSQRETSAKQDVTLAGGVIEVPMGSKSLITLPDGTKVWVNAGSKIRYAADFGVSSRDVYLTGEAYFDVAKMEQVPFFVNTDLMKIKVYGTAFNVKAYADDDVVETTLDRGAITIIRNDNDGEEVAVAPNQKITMLRKVQVSPAKVSSGNSNIPAQQAIEKMEVQEVDNTESITAWKDDRLVFEQEPLWSLAKRLERRYNVTFRFNNEKIKSLRYTAVLKEMPIDQVLKAISISSPISYQIQGTEIVLTENKRFNP